MATELKTQEWDAPQLRRHLEPHLRRRGGEATLGDIVAETGLPAERTEPVLRELLDEYNGRLVVDANGELVYSFPQGLRPREGFKESWEKIKAIAWSWFKIAFKVGYGIILVLYFVLFLAIMIAAMVVMLSASRSSDDLDFDFEGCGCSPFDLFWFMPTPGYHEPQTTFGRRGPTPYRARPAGATKRAPLWLQVFEFVFGEEKPAADELADERQLLAYIRDHNGRITAADIVALTGRSLEQAEQTLAHLMVAHGGDVEVSDNGTLIYTFDRVMISAGRRPGQREATRRWTWWWERPEQPRVLNRNSPTANVVIGLLNAFNLSWSGFFTFTGPPTGDPSGVWWWLFLGPVPFFYSFLFYLIPFVRWIKLNKENTERELRNRLREVARKLFSNHVATDRMPVVVPDEMVTYGREPGDRIHTVGVFRGLLDRLAQLWGGEPAADRDRRVGYRFNRLREEWADAEAARAAVDPGRWALGEIAYDTENEETGIEYEWRERMQGEERGDSP